MSGIPTKEERIGEIRARLRNYQEARPGSLIQVAVAHDLAGDVDWLLRTVTEQALLLERSEARISW